MSNDLVQKLAAKLRENQNRGRGNSTQSSGGDNASYPFWNIPEGSSATIRFLPDGDPDNTFFWVRREVIKLPFQGVEGGDNPTDRQVIVQVPCVEMWGMTCPILSETRPWWKDPAKEALARTYWKKKSYIFQGFVVNSPFEEKEVPANPIRRFVINPSIYEIIEKSLMNPEMEDLPIDYVGGRDMILRKTKQGQYANYSTSSWSFKVRSLNDDEQQAIATHGLFTLKDYLGRKPDTDELEAIKSMFHESLDGQPFDVASYGKWFRAFGSRDEDAASSYTSNTSRAPVAEERAPAARKAPAKAAVVEEADEAPAPKAAAASGDKPNAHDILERIKNRTLNK